jgi:hypothetical protein
VPMGSADDRPSTKLRFNCPANSDRYRKACEALRHPNRQVSRGGLPLTRPPRKKELMTLTLSN